LWTAPFRAFPVLLDHADEIFVTRRLACRCFPKLSLPGKPVGLVPIEQDDEGRRKLGDAPQKAGPDARRRDLRRFWDLYCARNS
jgi:hypothetical protein